MFAANGGIFLSTGPAALICYPWIQVTCLFEDPDGIILQLDQRVM